MSAIAKVTSSSATLTSTTSRYSSNRSGWIEVFHQALEVRLRQLLGEHPTSGAILRCAGNEYLQDTLKDKLLKTALLLSVVTPRYLKSQSCLSEIEEFCRGAEQSGGIRFQDKARLLKVVKTEVPLEDMPSPLQPLLGYEFYALDQAKQPREYPASPDRRRRVVQGVPRYARGSRLRHQDRAGGAASTRGAAAASAAASSPSASSTSPRRSPICARWRNSFDANCASVDSSCIPAKPRRRTARSIANSWRASSGRRSCRCTCWASYTARRSRETVGPSSKCRSSRRASSRKRAHCAGALASRGPCRRRIGSGSTSTRCKRRGEPGEHRTAADRYREPQDIRAAKARRGTRSRSRATNQRRAARRLPDLRPA